MKDSILRYVPVSVSHLEKDASILAHKNKLPPQFNHHPEYLDVCLQIP
jgi:hypothetical protein